MRFLILIMLLSLLPISLKAQSIPHTFTDGDIIYADQINENFEYLLGTSKSVSIDCSSSGVGINEAITQGYNHFIISGTCQENIDIDLSNYRSNRVLFFEGANANAVDKIQDNSSGDNNVINIDNGSISVFIINLTISGGNRGINVSDKTMLGVYGSRIEGYKDIGIASWSNTVVDVKNVVIDGGNLGRLGIRIGGNSNGTIKDSTVENNTSDGIGVYSSSDLWIEKTDVQNNSENGIQVFNSGHIYLRDDTLLTNNGNGLSLGRNSSASIKNIEIQSSEKNGLQIDKGSSVWIENSIINGGKKGIRVANNSEAHIYGNMISNFTYSGIQVEDGSVATIGGNNDSDGNSRGNTITGPIEKGIHISSNSQAELFANDISGYSKTGIEVNRNSSVRIGADWDQDTYSTIQRPEYGNTINGAELTGESVEDWQRGIQVSESSTIQLHRNLIENNSGGGIRVSENSVIELGGGNIIQDNMHTESDGEVDGTGIELRSGSTLEMWSDAQEREPNTITGNGRYAFRVEGSHLDLRGGDDGNTQNNRLVISGHQTGIRASKGSMVTLERVDVQNNDSGGIRLSENSNLNVSQGGATITGNGLNNDGWDGFGPGLNIYNNSSASVDRLIVSGNGRGVYVGQGSNFSGGWKDEDDTSLPTYMIEIKDNKKWALEIEDNSNLDLRNFEISGNSLEYHLNDDSSKYYSDAVRLKNNSNGQLRIGVITNNKGGVFDIRNNSMFDIRETTLENNGEGSGNLGEYKGARVSNHSHIDLNDITFKHDGYSGVLDIQEMSLAHLRDSNIVNTLGHGINVREKSQVSLQNSNITSSYEFTENDFTNGSNGIEANSYSKIEIWHDSNNTSNLNVINAAAFPLKARQNSEIYVNSALSLTSSLGWSQIYLEKGSKLYLNDSNEGLQTIQNIGLSEETEMHLNSDTWIIQNHDCYNKFINDVKVFRDAIIYQNGFGAILQNNNTNCITLD